MKLDKEQADFFRDILFNIELKIWRTNGLDEETKIALIEYVSEKGFRVIDDVMGIIR